MRANTAAICSLLLTATFTLTACSGSDDEGSENSPPRSQPSGDAPAAPAADAQWTEIDISTDALRKRPTLHTGATVAATEELPMLYVGSHTPPGESSRATVWPSTTKGRGEAQLLEVGGTHSWGSDAAGDSDLTVVVGGVWRDGTPTPFAMTSTDRATWSALDFPAEYVERAAAAEVVAVSGASTAYVAGVDSDHVAVVVDLESGDVRELPAWEGAQLTTVVGLVVRDDVAVALVEAREQDGGQAVIAYRSTDGTTTWEAVEALSGEEVQIAGVVDVNGSLVATGQHQVDTDTAASAWSTSDGGRWVREQIPEVENHRSGWDAALSAPVVYNGTVHAAQADSLMLHARVVHRTDSGRWEVMGTLDAWRGPGINAVLGADNDTLRTLRSAYGFQQFGSMRPNGAWRANSETSTVTPVEYVASVGLDSDTPVVVGGRSTAQVDGRSWTRSTEMTRFVVTDDGLQSDAWKPAAARDSVDHRLAADGSGRSVLVATKVNAGPSQVDLTDGMDVMGWVRGPRGRWKPATGLVGPRTETAESLHALADTWVVVGSDRNTFAGNAHRRGAVWTSSDGRSWERQDGPFNIPDRHSRLTGACQLPGGELFVVGWADDPNIGSIPIAYLRSGKKWKRVDLGGLGEGVTRLSTCAGVGGDVILQGSAPTAQAWRTVDGTTFEAVEIGDAGDSVGPIVALDDGYAAPGAISRGGSTRGVVWLSADGTTWRAVDVPSDRPLSAAEVLPWGGRLLVVMLSPGGPVLRVLDNPGELLDAS